MIKRNAYWMLPVIPLPLPVVPFPLPLPPIIPLLLLLALLEPVSSVAVVVSVERGPLPSWMVGETVDCVVSVVDAVVAWVVGVVVGMVVGTVVATGLELRQPQPASTDKVRTNTVMRMNVFFI